MDVKEIPVPAGSVTQAESTRAELIERLAEVSERDVWISFGIRDIF